MEDRNFVNYYLNGSLKEKVYLKSIVFIYSLQAGVFSVQLP